MLSLRLRSYEITHVTFKQLSSELLNQHLDSGRWFLQEYFSFRPCSGSVEAALPAVGRSQEGDESSLGSAGCSSPAAHCTHTHTWELKEHFKN